MKGFYMKDYTLNLPSPRLDENFKFYKIPYKEKQARSEASRCIYCYDAPCIKACATSINIPEFIRRIASGNLKGAAHTILSSNIMGFSCSRVCPVEVMCEGACVYNESDETPIHIGLLQEYTIQTALDKGWRFFEKGSATGKRVAVIGAGPAGLSCAHELTILGYEVVVFEGRDLPGGLNTNGIAPYKLSAKESLREVEYVQKIGFEIKTGVWAGKDKKYEDLDRDFDAIFIGVGLGLDKTMNVPGEDLEGYFGGLGTIEKIRIEKDFSLEKMKRVIVVGGGNTSLDLVRELKQLGVPEVTLLYRRGESEMKAYKHERDAAKKEGVLFELLAQPIEVVGKDGKVVGLKCKRMELAEPDESGRKRALPVEGSEFTLPADHIFVAIGQPPLQEFFRSIPQMELNSNLTIKVSETYQTTNPRVYAGGDCVNGGKEVVDAVAHGRDAARGIDRMLKK